MYFDHDLQVRFSYKIVVFSYLSVFVHFVVGEFDLLEGDDLLAELVAGEGRVGMRVEPRGRWRVRLAGDEPRGAVVRVPVALAVHRHHVQQHAVPRLRPAAGERHAHRRKHSPLNNIKNDIT